LERFAAESTAAGSDSNPAVKEVRGKGLMIGIELAKPCGEVVERALEKGVLVNCTGERVVRLVPPLVVSKEQLDKVISVLLEFIK